MNRSVGLLASVLVIISLASSVLAQEMVRLSSNRPATVPAVGVSAAPLDMRIGLSIGFSIKNRSSFDVLLEQKQDPSSKMYRQPLKRGEFEKYFGPTPTEYRAVLDWLKSEGVEITSDEEPKMYIWCIGTVAEAETAFQIKIVRLPTGAYWNEDDPAIPEEFSGLIESIVGLDNLHALKHRLNSRSSQMRSTNSS